MARKSDAAWEAAMYALNGLAGNPVNQGLTVAQLVEKALNIGVSMANRWEQCLGTAAMEAPYVQMVTAAAVPADPTINFVASVGATVNTVSKGVTESTVPTTVKNPDGTNIAAKAAAE
jgi:hypothetical protein